MPTATKVELSAEQRAELEIVRDRHSKAYMRERASGVLKMADGQSARQVALYGVHKVREPETISGWAKSYLKAGLEGWKIKDGRGRKASFSPHAPGRTKRSSGLG